MPWLLVSLGHQHLWYWLCRIIKIDEYSTSPNDIVSYISVQPGVIMTSHDDVIKGNIFCITGSLCGPLVNSPHKDQQHGALMFPFICAWTNTWANNGNAGDLKCHHAHYYVTVMSCFKILKTDTTWLVFYGFIIYFVFWMQDHAMLDHWLGFLNLLFDNIFVMEIYDIMNYLLHSSNLVCIDRCHHNWI